MAVGVGRNNNCFQCGYFSSFRYILRSVFSFTNSTRSNVCRFIFYVANTVALSLDIACNSRFLTGIPDIPSINNNDPAFLLLEPIDATPPIQHNFVRHLPPLLCHGRLTSLRPPFERWRWWILGTGSWCSMSSRRRWSSRSPAPLGKALRVSIVP